MAYDEKYRKQAIAYKEGGHTFRELKEVFGIVPETYYNWKKLYEITGSLRYEPVKTRKRKIYGEKLKEAVKEKPDAYLKEYAEQFGCGVPVVFHALEKLNITLKKRPSPTAKRPRKSDTYT